VTRQRDEIAAVFPLPGESALWKAVRDGNHAARERLIEGYLPYARMLAAKLFAGRTEDDQEFAEYLQFATVGLIEAADRFEPEREILFKTFASHRINGAILNGLEHMSEKREQISTRKRLAAERRDSAKVVLDHEDKDLFQQLAEIAVGLALGYVLDDPAASLYDEPSVPDNQYAGLELRQLREKLRSLVECLPQREKLVIKYHYLNQVPFNVIAETLGITKGRVSQIHHRALEMLHDKMKSAKACDVAW
jgi:RNA polymerase sigma factor FliA